MPVVHCNRNCTEREELKGRVIKLEDILKVQRASLRASSVLVVKAHRREEGLKKQLSEARLTISRLRLWKK